MVYGIGLDIGGTKIRAGLVSTDGTILEHIVQPTEKTPASVLAQIDALIDRLINSECGAIGIGVPGRVNAATGEVLSGGFVDLIGAPLANLAKAEERHILVDNDANMALFAEAKAGAARDLANVVMLTIGTGIGGALMLDGHIVRGRMAAGQLGHITIDINGPACLCGRSGCLETFSSGTAFRRIVSHYGLPEATTIETINRSRDPVARVVLESWIRPLRAGIDSLVASFDPDLVVLGGGIGGAACAALVSFPAPSPWYQCEVRPARLGDDAGVIGAALAAMERAQ